jgi:hypothetical protein
MCWTLRESGQSAHAVYAMLRYIHLQCVYCKIALFSVDYAHHLTLKPAALTVRRVSYVNLTARSFGHPYEKRLSRRVSPFDLSYH